MKTAQECLIAIAAAYRCPDVSVTETIRMIQLDALKEGMRRASNIAEQEQYPPAVGSCSTCASIIKMKTRRAAEQLTEKDL